MYITKRKKEIEWILFVFRILSLKKTGGTEEKRREVKILLF